MWKDNVNARFVIKQYATVQGHASVLDKFCKELIECEEDNDHFDALCLELRGKTIEVIKYLVKELNDILEREGE